MNRRTRAKLSRLWGRRCFERYNALQPRIPGEVMASIAALDDLEQLINLIAVDRKSVV